METSSSSATICARPVCTPCPSSTWPLRAVTEPSAWMVSQVASAVGSRAGKGAAALAASVTAPITAPGPAAITTRTPPAFRNVRLLSSCVMAASPHRPGGALHRGDDAHIGAAPAEVRRWRRVRVRVADLRLGRARDALQQVDRDHHHAALAVAALRNLLVDPGLLHRMQGRGRLVGRQALLLRPARGQALERGHVFLDGRPRRDAGADLT